MHFDTPFMRCLINVEPHVAVNIYQCNVVIMKNYGTSCHNTIYVIAINMSLLDIVFVIQMFSFVRTGSATIHHTNYFVVSYSVYNFSVRSVID